MTDALTKPDPEDPDDVEVMVFTPPEKGPGSRISPEIYNKAAHMLIEGRPQYHVQNELALGTATIRFIALQVRQHIPDQGEILLQKAQAFADKGLTEMNSRDLSEVGLKELSVPVGIALDKVAQAKPKLVQHQHAHIVVDADRIQAAVDALPAGPDDTQSPGFSITELDNEGLTEEDK